MNLRLPQIYRRSISKHEKICPETSDQLGTDMTQELGLETYQPFVPASPLNGPTISLVIHPP